MASLFISYGNTTKLTLGRYSDMEAYTCTDLGLESRDVVVYNHSKKSGDFSDHGDSGSLIFTGSGDGLAILHSGMPRGINNHVTTVRPSGGHEADPRQVSLCRVLRHHLHLRLSASTSKLRP